MQQVNTLKAQVREHEEYFNLSKSLLKQVKDTLSKKNLDPTSVANYAIKVFQGPHALRQFLFCLRSICRFYTLFFNVIGPLARPLYFI